MVTLGALGFSGALGVYLNFLGFLKVVCARVQFPTTVWSGGFAVGVHIYMYFYTFVHIYIDSFDGSIKASFNAF